MTGYLMPTLMLSALAAGALYGTDPTPEPAPFVATCKDFRDGETFSFRSEDILDSGMAVDWPPGAWIKVRDTDGNARTLWPRDSKHLKCKQEQE